MRKTLTRLAALLSGAALLFSAASAKAAKSVLMTFTGDCTLGCEERVRGSADSFAAFVDMKGYDYFFARFRDIFESDDLTVINFEGVLKDDAGGESKSKTYRFRGTSDYTQILTGSSVEAAGLSNNHVEDYGIPGLQSTKEILAKSGVNWFQNFSPFIYEKDGIRIAFFAVNNRVISGDFDKLKKEMRRLKAEDGVHAVVVCWHTGSEYHGNHDESTERIGKGMIDNGADLLIMHHPHVLQGIGMYNNRYLFYSMGNFVFGGNSAIREEKYRKGTVSSLYSMVVQVKMDFSDDGVYLGQQATVFPAYTSGAAPVNNYQPFPVTGEEAEVVRAALQADTLFDLPALAEQDGRSRMDLPYLTGFDGDMVPEAEDDQGPIGVPEAAEAAPTRDTK